MSASFSLMQLTHSATFMQELANGRAVSAIEQRADECLTCPLLSHDGRWWVSVNYFLHTWHIHYCLRHLISRPIVSRHMKQQQKLSIKRTITKLIIKFTFVAVLLLLPLWWQSLLFILLSGISVLTHLPGQSVNLTARLTDILSMARHYWYVTWRPLSAQLCDSLIRRATHRQNLPQLPFALLLALISTAVGWCLCLIGTDHCSAISHCSRCSASRFLLLQPRAILIMPRFLSLFPSSQTANHCWWCCIACWKWCVTSGQHLSTRITLFWPVANNFSFHWPHLMNGSQLGPNYRRSSALFSLR